MKKQMRTVLIVDDFEVYRKEVRDTLKKIDPYITILEASNGGDAFIVYQNNVPDLIITDLMMPITWGDELAAVIRDTNTGKDKTIYLMSSEPDECRYPEHFNAIFDKTNLYLLQKQLLEDYYGRRRDNKPGPANRAYRNRVHSKEV